MLTRQLAQCTLHSMHRVLPNLLLQAPMRSMSGSAVVDQMLSYVWKDLQAQGQSAIDVLRSGLQLQPDPSKGFDSARLKLALAEVFAAEHNWAEAASCSQEAARAAAADSNPEAAGVAGLANFQAARALLVAGKDGEAATSSWPQGDSAVQLAHQLMVQHATSSTMHKDAATTALQQLQQALAEQKQPASSSSGGGSGVGHGSAQGVLLALSHKVAGDVALAVGDLDSASSSFDAAKQALGGSSSNSSDGAAAVSFMSDPGSCLSSRFQQEVAADIALGAAQVLMARKQWDASEEALSSALAAAEAAGGERSPLLAPVLLLLGYGYARSARVMFAEGMLREAAKLVGGTEPARLADKSGGSSTRVAHPSLKAALCWRYCQLLSALPNRGAEAAAWGKAADTLWDRAGSGFGDAAAGGLEAVLGDDTALKGQGEHGHGRGAVVSLFLRRLLPVLPV